MKVLYNRKMIRWVFTLLLVELFFAVINTRGDRLSRPGNWPQYRGNKQLTGRSLSRGRITQPKILWRHFTGARQTLLTVKLQSEDIVQPLPSIDYDATGGDLDAYYRGGVLVGLTTIWIRWVGLHDLPQTYFKLIIGLEKVE